MSKILTFYKIKTKYVFYLLEHKNKKVREKIMTLETPLIIAKEKEKMFNVPESLFAVFDEFIPESPHKHLFKNTPIISFWELKKKLEKDNFVIKIKDVTSDFEYFYEAKKEKYINIESETIKKILGMVKEIRSKFNAEKDLEFFDSLNFSEFDLKEPTSFISFKSILYDFFEWTKEKKSITRSPLNFERNLNKFTETELRRILKIPNERNPEKIEIKSQKNIGIIPQSGIELRVLRAIQKLFKEQIYIGDLTLEFKKQSEQRDKRFRYPVLKFRFSDFYKSLGLNHKTSGAIYKKYRKALDDLAKREHTIVSIVKTSDGKEYRLTYTTNLYSIEKITLEKKQKQGYKEVDAVYSLRLSRIFFEGLNEELDPEGVLAYTKIPDDLLNLIDSKLKPQTKKLPYYFLGYFFVLKINDTQIHKKKDINFDISYEDLSIKINLENEYKKQKRRFKEKVEKMLSLFKDIELIKDYSIFKDRVNITLNPDFLKSYT